MRRFALRAALAGGGATVAFFGFAGPAFAGDYYCPPPPPPPTEKVKCNSGNGNGSEAVVSGPNCIFGDPGQSFFHNRGGDEIVSPAYGGIPNPGGNNV